MLERPPLLIFGARTVALYLVTLTLAAVSAGLALDALFPAIRIRTSLAAGEGPGLLSVLSAVLLGLLLLREILWKPLFKGRGCACGGACET